MTIRVQKNPSPNIPGFEEVIAKNLSEKVKDDSFAQQLYASLCNTIWYNKATKDIYSCSWRYAGGLVATMRYQSEDYMDFYCSGGEGEYHKEIYKELKKLGYVALSYKDFSFLQEHKFK